MLNAFRAAATVTAAAFVGTVALLVLAILAGIAVTLIGLAAGPLLDALSRRQLLP